MCPGWKGCRRISFARSLTGQAIAIVSSSSENEASGMCASGGREWAYEPSTVVLQGSRCTWYPPSHIQPLWRRGHEHQHHHFACTLSRPLNQLCGSVHIVSSYYLYSLSLRVSRGRLAIAHGTSHAGHPESFRVREMKTLPTLVSCLACKASPMTPLDTLFLMVRSSLGVSGLRVGFRLCFLSAIRHRLVHLRSLPLARTRTFLGLKDHLFSIS